MDRRLLDEVRWLLRPLSTRIANTIARAVVSLADDTKKLQLIQLGALADETIDDAEHHQPYGFSSVPLAGAEAVVVFPNGYRSHPLAVVVSDRRYRPTAGQPGEVTVYNNTGAKVVITKDGDIVATPASGRHVKLGSAAATVAAALASELADLKSRINLWAPVAGDGGASLKAIFTAWTVGGATKVRIE